MDVCYVFDKGYIEQFEVAAYSLAVSNRDEQIAFHLLTHGFDEADRAGISEFMQKIGASFVIYDIDEATFEMLPKLRDRSYATYYKLLIFQHLKHLSQVLYLDCDIIVRKPIKDFFSADSEKGLVVVRDKHVNKKEKEHVIAINGEPDGYFNAGVMLFRFDKFRDIPTLDEMIGYAAEHKDILMFHDQDVFNHFFSHSCDYTDEKYNYFTEYFQWYEVVFSDKRKAAIVHYAATKPWNSSYSGKYYGLYKKTYKECARLTPLHFMQKRKSVFVRTMALFKRLFLHIGRKFKKEKTEK